MVVKVLMDVKALKNEHGIVKMNRSDKLIEHYSHIPMYKYINIKKLN